MYRYRSIRNILVLAPRYFDLHLYDRRYQLPQPGVHNVPLHVTDIAIREPLFLFYQRAQDMKTYPQLKKNFFIF